MKLEQIKTNFIIWKAVTNILFPVSISFLPILLRTEKLILTMPKKSFGR